MPPDPSDILLATVDTLPWPYEVLGLVDAALSAASGIVPTARLMARLQVHAALVRPSLLVKGQSALEARAGRPDDELLKVQLKRLDRRLQQADVERRRVCDLYQMQAIERHEFQARHQAIVDRHHLLKQERDALVAQRQELAVNNRLARKVESFAERVREGIDSLDFDQRQRLLRLLVEQVRVTGPGGLSQGGS